MTTSGFTLSICLYVLLSDAKCLPVKNSIKRVNAYWGCQSLLAASVPSSWPWNPIWTLMKGLSVPEARQRRVFASLYITPPLLLWSEPGASFFFFLPLGEPPGKKQFINSSSAFKPYQVWCGGDWQLHQLILQESAESAQSCGYIGVDGKGGLLVFMQQQGYWGGGVGGGGGTAV